MEEIVFQFSMARHRKIKHILGFFSQARRFSLAQGAQEESDE